MAGKDDDTIPGLTLDAKLANKLDGLDDQLNPIREDLKEDGSKDAKAEGKEDDSEDQKGEKTGEAGDSKEAGEAADDDSGDKGADEGDDSSDEGYTIDEGDEEKEDKPTTPEEKQAQEATNNLNPEQKYIIDNLQPIKVRGTIGAETDVKEYEVYSPEYLPQGFKFVDDREMSAANKAFAGLEQRAVQLQSDYRNQETQKASTEFKKREDTADRQDIATLQKSGQLPRFKAQPNSPDFDKDPGVQLVQEVIDYKESQNTKYMQEYQAGRPYKHIGFEEAFRMYQRDNPTKSNPAQTNEDKTRADMAKRTSKTSGSSSKEERPKAGIHTGMTSMDLDNLIESKTSGW